MKTKNVILKHILSVFLLAFPFIGFAGETPVLLNITDDWGNGFVGDIKLTNTTNTAYTSWIIEFDFPYSIDSIWSAKIKSHTGNHYVIENESWNGAVAPDQTVTFGFQGSPGNITDTISNVKVNGNSNNEPTQNSPPSANNDTVTTEQDTAILINVLENDTDQDNDVLTITSITSPSNGQAIVQGASINYIPNNDFTGNDSFSYTISDNNGGTDSADVNINISPVNPGPNPTEGFEYNISTDWGSGFNGEITLTNSTNYTSSGWTVEFDFPYNITQIWSADIISHSGDHYKIQNVDWNASLIPNASASFGFGAAPGNAIDKPSNVVITINTNGGLPVANNDTGITDQNTTVTLNVLSNDTGDGISITSVTVPSHGATVVSDNSVIYTPEDGFFGNDTFNYSIIDAAGLTATGTVYITVREPVIVDKRIVGYWQNWYDASKADEYIQFRDISSKYNVINVAFAKPKSDTDPTIEFNLDTSGGTTVEEFKSLISQYKAEGKKVLISLGGAVCPTLKLSTETDKQKFATSLISIIVEYGFSGLDIDLEGSSVGLDSGDNDFRNPTTKSMINLISAIKEIHDYFGSEFVLTATPETAYVQGGISGYDGFWGAYLPLLNALRNEIDQIHIQYYNSGSIYGTDGNMYYEGTPDFLVALSEALITGFNVRNSDNEYIFFEGFRPDQVAFGILTSEQKGSGSMHSTEINKALDYIVKGIPFDGQYVLNNSNGYTDFGGIMGWSMTVDKRDYNNEFIDNAYNYFYGSTPIPNSSPIAVDDIIETTEETPITIDVLDNDTDADNDVLTISSLTAPQNGTTEITSSAILYTPNSGFTGTDTFEYTVNDGNDGTDTAIVTITVSSNEPVPATYTITASVVNNGTGSESYPEFVQPMAGDTLYMKGDKVTFSDKAYESLIDNNSWSPANYPAGWKEIFQGNESSSGNGTITPSGEVIINDGQSQTFTITPDSGCAIKDVKVDNVSKGTVTSYTFNNVTSDHTISVEFIQNSTPNPNVSPTVVFTAPTNNQTITQTDLSSINISVNAQNSDGTVENITIEVDGNEYTGNSASWTPSEFGTYTITATAEDDNGATAAAVITVIVAKANSEPQTDRKLVIGYFTQWEAWFGTEHGYPEKGVANQLNIDYSKFTNINYSFFGVAKDGSLFSGDFRNKEIYKEDVEQDPRPLLYADYYSSWDYWLLFGELETIWDAASANLQVAEERFVEVNEIPSEIGYSSNHDQLGSKVWLDNKTGIKGVMPIMLPKENGAKGLIQLCQENNVKLSASIGGWSMCKHFPEVAADPVKRTRFVSDCQKLIDMGFDGIDIDWEYPGTIPGMNFSGSDDDYENFAILMEEIRETIGSDKLLTAAFSCDPRKLEKYDWNRLQNSMDYFNMMTYDMEGGWSTETGHNSSLYGPADTDYSSGLNYSWNKTFNYLVNIKGIPAEKINMGIALYGRGVITEDSAALNTETSKSDLWIDPDGYINSALDIESWGGTRYLTEDALLNALLNGQYGAGYYGQPNYFYIKHITGADNNWNTGWTRCWDDIAKAPYAVRNNSFISYDDEESIGYKADYVMDNDLGGVIIWHVTGDWEVGPVTNTYGNLKKAQVTTPLLNVIHNSFNEENDNPTTESNYEFPQHVNYALSHIMPNNYTQNTMDDDVRSFYDYWKQSYIVDAGTDSKGNQMYRINYDGDTVSEGQGYGMIITALMSGYDPKARNIFDGLWYFTRTMPSEINSNFMDWSLLDTSGNDSAFDGDADIAYALLIADKQWGSDSDINYKSEAVKIINAIRSNLISNTTHLPFLGDWVSQNDSYWSSISRPSDFMLANFRAFNNAVSGSDWEESVVNACLSKLQYLQNNFSSTTGLVPDFILNGDPAAGQVLESNNDGKYFYNSCRVPMRVGLDALLSNNPVSKTIAAKISNWAESSTAGNINSFYAGYELDGSSFADYSVTSFTAPLGVAAMCSGQQTWLNSIYTHIKTNHTYTYYEDTLNLICMLIISGNYWDSTIIQ